MIRNIFLLLFSLTIGYLGLQIHIISQERNEFVFDHAHINSINYGLFSVNSWKDGVSEVLSKKIREFELNADSKEELHSRIESALHQLLDEIHTVVEEKIDEGKTIEKLYLSIIEKLLFNIEDLRKKVPEFTDMIMEELEKEENRVQLKVMIQRKLEESIDDAIDDEAHPRMHAIIDKYNSEDQQQCSNYLQDKVNVTDKKLWNHSILLLILAVLAFALVLINPKKILFPNYIFLVFISLVIILLGITIPMIEIDARIDEFTINLLGEQLSFTNQVLFYQSKSIFEVVQILVQSSSYQSIFVGCLIFLFSIIFPLLKLISSLALAKQPHLQSNKMMYFFAIKSGKWSMADVFVVAIFMAFIGFRGVLRNQLNQLENFDESVQVITTDQSTFGVGFIMFLAFCLLGLILSTSIERNIK